MQVLEFWRWMINQISWLAGILPAEVEVLISSTVFERRSQLTEQPPTEFKSMAGQQ
jgi:hypothetical protein